MLCGPTIFHLIGFPGAGKFTIAKHMAHLQDSHEHRLVVVDNHYFNNTIFGVLDVDGIRPLDPRVWDHVRQVRDAVLETIRDLSPPTWSFVFTNVLFAGDAGDEAAPERLAALAEARGGPFVPVRLHCDVDELARRVVSPERKDRLKWIDAEGVRAIARSRALIPLPYRHALDLDVTGVAPEVAARRILDHAAATAASQT